MGWRRHAHWRIPIALLVLVGPGTAGSTAQPSSHDARNPGAAVAPPDRELPLGTAGAQAPGETVEPRAYYRFDNGSNILLDSQGSCDLTWEKTGSSAVPVQQPHAGVGGCLQFNVGEEYRNISAPRAWGAGACDNLTAGSTAVAIEFLLSPTPKCFLRGGSATLFRSDSLVIEIAYNSITWSVTSQPKGGAGPSETTTLSAALEGQGVLAADYLWSGKVAWHHLVFMMDLRSGLMSVWLDGQSPPGLQKVANATTNVIATGGSLVLDERNPVALCAELDEVAIYNTVLPAALVYRHYQDAVENRQPYSTQVPSTPAPPPTPWPNATNASHYDAEEYSPGSQLPSPPGEYNNTQGAETPCLEQLQFTAAPRYNTSTPAMPYLFNWMSAHYLAGVSRSEKFNDNVTLAVQKVVSSRWRYGIEMHPVSSSLHWIDNATFALANARPEVPLHVIIMRRQVHGGSQLFNQSLPKGCYLQNAAGDFITVLGQPVPAGSKKTLRAMSAKLADSVGCPDSIFNADGLYIRGLFRGLAPLLSRPIDVVNADGEIFISLMSPAEYFNYSADPAVRADYEASGAANWETFFSEWRVRLTNGWTSVFMHDPQLEQSLLKGAAFTMYQVQGDNAFFGNWSITREIMTPMFNAHTKNDTFYSTADLYLQRPSEHFSGGGPDHGIQWLQTVRPSELALGDVLFSPFVAAGWSGKAEHNLRPAQWLGFLKILTSWGAEWFYTGFFSLRAPFPPSQNWCWQAMMPPYAQAIMSQVEPFLYDGSLVLSTPNTTFGMGEKTGSPLLWAGYPHVYATARALGDALLITAALSRLSNAAHNLVAPKLAVDVHVPGLASPVPVEARLQGSTYVWRNDTTDPQPVLYQVDDWHQASHPVYWPQTETRYQAELFQGHLSLPAANCIITDWPSRRAAANPLTYVRLARCPHGLTYAWPLHTGRLRIRARGGSVVVSSAPHSTGTAQILAQPAWELDFPDSGSWTWQEVHTDNAGFGLGAQLRLSGSADVDCLLVLGST